MIKMQEKINNIETDLKKLDRYIENLEERKRQLEKEILRKKLLIEELKNY